MTLATPRRPRARLALEGLSLGDAYGELCFRGCLQPTLLRMRPWRWTDDTAMALGLLEVLEVHGAVDQDALAAIFGRNYLADPRRGYGAGAHDILTILGHRGSWREVAPRAFGGQGSKGNGGAMRVGPLGAWFAEGPDEAVAQARLSAQVTHAHPEGQAGAMAVAAAAAWACRARGHDPDPRQLLAVALQSTPEGETREGVARAWALPLAAPVGEAAAALGNGSLVCAPDTVPFALWCAARGLASYPQALVETAAGGGDIDTNCAIVGGIVACKVGRLGLPRTWLAAREPLPANLRVPPRRR